MPADRNTQNPPSTPPTGDTPGAFEGETVSRRRFMNISAQGAGGIAVAAFTLPALGFAVGPVFKRTPFSVADHRHAG